MSEPFECLLRVRYGDADAQGVVFNARWGDFVDAVATEFFCALFEKERAKELPETQLVRQEFVWRSPARFDDVLVARARVLRVGDTSFTTRTEFYREGEAPLLMAAETTYVAVDPSVWRKRSLTEPERARLAEGAAGRRCDLSGARRAPR